MGINEMIDAVVVCVKCGQPRGKCDCWIWKEDLKRFVENPDSKWNKKHSKIKEKNENVNNGKA